MFAILILGLFLFTSVSFAQINLTLSKSHNATSPIASGQQFTYTLTYSWSGGAPGTLYIVDNVPSSLDVLSALPGNPISVIAGNLVTFTLTGLALPSGSGTVQINVRFKPGVTCGGVVATNRASISLNPQGPFVYSPAVSITSAQPVNRWTFEKEWVAGCALDDEVIYRIKIMAPSGNDIGGLNLTNISLTDIVPVNSFIPAGGVSVWWTGFTGASPNYALTGGPTTLGVSSYPVWYMAYVKVKYPSSFFTVGQTVINTASMRFNTPCNSQFVTWTDTAKTVLCTPNSQGSIGKWLQLGLYFPNNPSWYPIWSPGCCGTYRLYYNNSGNVGQPGFVMEDVLPGEVDVNAIHTTVPAGNTPVTVDVYCWVSGVCSATPCTTVVYNSVGFQTLTLTSLPGSVCKVKWTYSNSIAVTQQLNNYIDVCVRNTNFQNGNPVIVGQNVTNTMNVSATNLSTMTVTQTQAINQTQPKVLATKLFIGSCNNACQINPYGPFQPGDIVRYRMAVTNIGNANATSCTITDMLPAGLSYVGNETYFYGGYNWIINQWNPPCCSTSVTVPSQIGGTISTPSVGATSLAWTFSVLPSRCDGTVDWFIIEFDVKVSSSPPAAPGQYNNTFTIGASNITNVVSNVAQFTVNQVAQMQAIKEVRQANSDGSFGPWSSNTTITPGGSGQFRLTVTNTGNTLLTGLCLLDIMPWAGDIKVLPPYNPRGSNFDLPYDPLNGALAITPAGFAATYNTTGYAPSKNPTRSTECGGFCGVTDPGGAVAGVFNSTPTMTFSFKVTANSGVNLLPGNSLVTTVPFTVPKQVKPQQIACNSFGVQARPLNMANICLSAESNNACITVGDKPPCIRVVEPRINCVSKDANGNWVYLLQFIATNLSGSNANITINPSVGTIVTVNPTMLPNGVPTNVNAAFVTPNPNGQVCFTIWLFDPKTNIELCDTTICLDIKPCPEPCPCPFEIKFEKANGHQATGNQAYFSNLLSVLSNPVLQVRASVVSATVTQYCLGGSYTTYNSGATFVSTSLNPLLTSGLGTSEVTWTNYSCPQIVNAPFNFYLNIPTTPSKGCYQKVKVCIRYTITDCKCNTCDTLVCYEFVRKWIPIFDPVDHKWDRLNANPTSEKKIDMPLSLETPFLTMNMTSDTEGKLTISNPAEDEYTAGITLIAVRLSSTPGISILSMSPDLTGWTNGISDGSGTTSTGELLPGKILNFDIKFENQELFKTWVNKILFAYTIQGVPDTLYGENQLRSRTPGASGGDELNEDNFSSTLLKDGKAFSFRFLSNNITHDSIAKVVIRVKNGNILAVGPQFGQGEVTLTGFRTTGGERKLLTASPDHNDAVIEAIPGQNNVGPIFVYAVYEGTEFVEFEYETYTQYDELVTKGTVRIETPTTGIDDGGIGQADIYLSNAVPNPAQNQSTINFRLAKSEPDVSLVVTDQRGSIVTKLIDGKEFSSGEHNLILNTQELTNGVYYFTLSTPTSSQTRKIVIIK